MSHDKLIRMANQIATFFASQPGTDQAERVAAHLKDFWAPAMRAELVRCVREGRPEVSPLVAAAVALLDRQHA